MLQLGLQLKRETMDDQAIQALVVQAADGDEKALAELFGQYKKQLRRMIAMRMDPILKGRVDPSDVLQDAYLDLHKRLPEFEKSGMPFFLWMRFITKEQLLRTHRTHVNAQMRDARREVSGKGQIQFEVTSACLAAQLMGKYSSVADKAIRVEQNAMLMSVLDCMPDTDREIISLRIFEGLSNGEAAQATGLTKQTVSKRFIRALLRIKEVLRDLKGFKDEFDLIDSELEKDS